MSISDSDYEGKFTIPTPKGIYQAAGDTNINADYAYRAQNIRTERGLLASAYGTSRAFPSLGAQIKTLTRFYRRSRPDDADVYVAAAEGAIYTYTLGTEGWVKRSEGYKSDEWSSVTYEAADGGETVDILILSNEKDGMIAVYGNDLRVEKKTLTIGDAYGEVKFATLGRNAERHPDLVQRIHDEGHEIGIHTYSHPNLRHLNLAAQSEQIGRVQRFLRSLGIEARFLRPPYGSFNDITLKAAEQMDLKVVLWSLDSEDWRGVREDYAALVNTRGQRYVNNDLRGIFLFHDTVHGTLENLPRIIAQLQAGGCQRFVTVSDFLDGSLDPEPPLLMARRTRQPLPDGRELMPPESFPDVQLAGQETGRSGFDAAQRASSTRDTSLIWAAGSTPVPMARSSSPRWGKAAEQAREQQARRLERLEQERQGPCMPCAAP